MGLIKKIFGGIFGLIGGIFGSIAKVFGIGKQGDFYMELDDAAAPAAASSAPVKAESAPAPVKVVNSDESAQPAAAPAQEQIPTAPAQAKSEPVPAAPAKVEMPEIANFATDYLINPRINRSPRRRPGPSMSPFKDMVKEMGRRSPSMG